MVAEIPMPNFAQMYREHYLPVLKLFYRSTKNRQDAEDLTQVAFEKAAKNFQRFDDKRASFATWIHHIAYNVKIDYLRKKKSERSDLHTEFEEKNNSPYSTSPQDEFIGREVEARINECLKNQHPDSIDTLLLGTKGLSDKEISQILDVSVDTVNVRKFRMRARIKEYLRQE